MPNFIYLFSGQETLVFKRNLSALKHLNQKGYRHHVPIAKQSDATRDGIKEVIMLTLNSLRIEDLKHLGSENTFIRLKTVAEGACINELLALEGAIQGIRWHNLDEDRKLELKTFHKILQKKW